MFSKDKILRLILGCSITCSYSQITQINSGTSEALNNLSIIDKNIVICSNTNNYLVKSYNECKQLIPLPCPGPSNYYYYLQRLDTNTLYLLANGNGSILYKSIDGGLNWKNKWSTGFAPSCVAFFDTLEGITDKGIMNNLLRTLDGGITWSTSTSPLYSIDIAKTYGDSMVIMGGANFPYPGGLFYLSKDRGNSWPYSWTFAGLPNDFFFLNKDSIFAVSSPDIWGDSYFAKTTDGGNTWQNILAPLHYSNGISFRNGNNGYVVGADMQNNASIAKTTDLGQTWSIYNTGIKSQLIKLSFLNDSIAIITGNNGVILRWNYKSTVFTGIDENKLNESVIKIFPIPTTKSLHFKSKFISTANFIISNTIGQIVFSKNDFDLQQELDLSFLSSGLYFLDLRTEKERQLIKILKE